MDTIQFVMKKPRGATEVFASDLRRQGPFMVEYGSLVERLGADCGRAYAETPKKIGIDIAFIGASADPAKKTSHYAVLGEVNGPNGHSISYFKKAA